jgi:hypothetical protein
MYSLDEKQALVEVSRFLVGTWTYTQNGNWWYRLNVDPSGKATLQQQLPNGRDWGSVESATLHPITAKYMSTGKRWYGFKVITDFNGPLDKLQCVIPREGVGIMCGGNATYYPMFNGDLSETPFLFRHGDIFPFEK